MTASGWVGPAARRGRLPHAVGANTAIAIPPAAAISTTACRARRSPRATATPTCEDITAYVNAGVPLEGDWNIYGWAGYQQREGDSAAFPRIFNDARNVPAIYPNGFLPLITTDIDDLALGWGVRGKLGELGCRHQPGLRHERRSTTASRTASTPRSAPPRRPSFDAGGMDYDQLVFNAGIVRGFDWAPARAA